jgi:hypothetical protein
MKPEVISLLIGLIGALTGASASIAIIIVQQHFETKRERMRLYQSDLLAAYRSLYTFAAHVEDMLSPPEDIRRDFRELMQRSYFPQVKPNILLFPQRIRKILATFESQYDCLGNPDLIASPPFDEFMRNKAGGILEKLRRAVEGRTDRMLGL